MSCGVPTLSTFMHPLGPRLNHVATGSTTWLGSRGKIHEPNWHFHEKIIELLLGDFPAGHVSLPEGKRSESRKDLGHFPDWKIQKSPALAILNTLFQLGVIPTISLQTSQQKSVASKNSQQSLLLLWFGHFLRDIFEGILKDLVKEGGWRS